MTEIAREDEIEAETSVSRERKRRNSVRRKEKKPTVPAVPAQPMITVWVNDRLGTKQPIPCLTTDPISEYNSLTLRRLAD
jgi:hypothetical protein